MIEQINKSLDDKRVTNMVWGTYKRAQFAFNLAIGSLRTSFNSNGFWPIDLSRFPMKYGIKRLEFWTAQGLMYHPTYFKGY